MGENNTTKFRLYKLHAEQDIDVSHLEKGIATLVQSDEYLSPERAIAEQIMIEPYSDNYGIIYTSEKRVTKKGLVSKKITEVDLEAVVMGNDQQLRIIKDYLLRNNIQVQLSVDVKEAVLTYKFQNRKVVSSQILANFLCAVFEIKKVIDDFQGELLPNSQSMGNRRGPIKEVINWYRHIKADPLGLGFNDVGIVFEYGIK